VEDGRFDGSGMRILFVNHNVIQRGGTFYRAFHFGKHLAKRGHDVTLMTISAHARWTFSEDVVDGVRVVQTPDLLWGLGRTGWDAWDVCARVLKLAGAGHWDVVHAWDCRPVVILPALYVRFAGRRASRLVIDWCDWWGRGGTQSERPQRWMKLVAPCETFFEEAFRTRADGTTVISEALRERVIALGVSPTTVRLLPQGCDEPLPSSLVREAARRQLRLPERGKVVIAIGALMPADARLLLAVLPKLFERRPDCRFFLIGDHGAHLPDAIRRHPQFTETGFVPASVLDAFVGACDCLLTPLADTLATRARWPSKINLALAAGRAVVTTAGGDLPQLLQRSQAAGVARCDADDLARVTLRVLEDDALRESYEARSMEVARDLLAWPILSAQLEDFYASVRCTAPRPNRNSG